MKIKRPASKQPIPPDAKLVFKGIIFDVYQWQQKMFDGNYQTFEKIKRPDTVMVIPLTADRKIILTEQEQPGKNPFVGFAGGRLEPGEDPIEGAKRELLEETGYEATKFVEWMSVHPGSKLDWVVYTLIAKGCKKVADLNLDSGEKIKLRFVDFDEFLDIVINQKFEDIEVAIEILKAKINPERMQKLRSLFLD